MIERLHYISQEGSNGETHAEMSRRACEAGVRWVQLRIKDKSDEYCIEQARETLETCKHYGAKLIINDRVSVAKAVNADGVHLGKEDLGIMEARQTLGDKIIGGTANTFDDVVSLINQGVDYVGLGPYRFTSTKQKLSPILGLEGYAQILQHLSNAGLSIPIVAIGGILQEDVSQLRATGLHGIAVASLINFAKEPNQQVLELNQRLYESIENSQQVI